MFINKDEVLEIEMKFLDSEKRHLGVYKALKEFDIEAHKKIWVQETYDNHFRVFIGYLLDNELVERFPVKTVQLEIEPQQASHD